MPLMTTLSNGVQIASPATGDGGIPLNSNFSLLNTTIGVANKAADDVLTYATVANLHIARTDNPHSVTAAQLGAAVLSGGNTFAGTQIFSGTARLDSLLLFGVGGPYLSINSGTIRTNINAGTARAAFECSTLIATTIEATNFQAATNNVSMSLAGRSFSSNVRAVSIAPTYTNTSGANAGALVIEPTYNQLSGTATNTDLLISRTQTAVGSGTQLLIDAQVGGSSKFSVDNTGVINTVTNYRVNANEVLLSASALNVRSNYSVNWSNDANGAFGTKDIGLARSAAGVLKITDGSTGFGNATVGALTLNPISNRTVTFVSLGGNVAITTKNTALDTYTKMNLDASSFEFYASGVSVGSLTAAGLLTATNLAGGGTGITSLSGAAVNNSGAGYPSSYRTLHWFVADSDVTTGIPAEGTLPLNIIMFPSGGTITDVAVEVTVAGSAGAVIRIGVYADDGNNGPSTLLVDAGTVDATTTGVKTLTLATPITIPSTGRKVWVGAVVQGAAVTRPTVRWNNSPMPGIGSTAAATIIASKIQSYLQSSVTGALPNPFVGAGSGTFAARVALKVS